MKSKVIVDAGPLVALLNGTDSAHGWVMQQLSSHAPPMLTCEAVLAEATYLTRHMPGARTALIEMIGDGFLSIGMAVADHHSALLGMIKRYADVPMSLADGCLVRMAELYPQSPVFTLDKDFSIYRKNGRQVISVIMKDLQVCGWLCLYQALPTMSRSALSQCVTASGSGAA